MPAADRTAALVPVEPAVVEIVETYVAHKVMRCTSLWHLITEAIFLLGEDDENES